jgi:hypothetical protein
MHVNITVLHDFSDDLRVSVVSMKCTVPAHRLRAPISLYVESLLIICLQVVAHCTGQYFDFWHCMDHCVSSCSTCGFAGIVCPTACSIQEKRSDAPNTSQCKSIRQFVSVAFLFKLLEMLHVVGHDDSSCKRESGPGLLTKIFNIRRHEHFQQNFCQRRVKPCMRLQASHMTRELNVSLRTQSAKKQAHEHTEATRLPVDVSKSLTLDSVAALQSAPKLFSKLK